MDLTEVLLDRAGDDDEERTRTALLEKRERRREVLYTFLYTLYIVLANFRPSEAFLVDFLLSKEVEGLETERCLSRSVLAVFTYFRGPALLLCLVLCRLLGCKAVVVLGSLCSLATTVLTINTHSLLLLQVGQGLIAFSFASCIAFDALQFNGVRQKKFQLVSHFTKGFTLASCCASSLLGQSLRRHFGDKNLFAITLGFEILALGVALFLPREQTTQKKQDGDGERDTGNEHEIGKESQEGHGGLLEQGDSNNSKDWKKERRRSRRRWWWWWFYCCEPFGKGFSEDMRNVWVAMNQGEIIRWTILWAFCYAIHNLVLTNWQVLAQLRLAESTRMPNLNGYTLSAGYLMSAVLTLGTSSCGSLYRYCSVIMWGAPALMAMTLFTMGLGNLATLYISFIFFNAVFQVMAAVRTASLAKRLTSETEEEAKDSLGAQDARSLEDPLMGGKEKRLKVKANTTFVLSVLLWLASAAAVGFEAFAQWALLYLASLSFADQRVWELMASVLGILSFSFVTYFLGSYILRRKNAIIT